MCGASASPLFAVGNEVLAGGLAIGAGVVLGLILFVPFVAVSYRRRGRLTLGRSLLWAAALVYFFAIWTYTLIPLPDPDTIVCAGYNTDPLQAIDDLRGARDRGHALTDPATLQLALNVLLFIPFGAFVRILGGRGLPTALVAGAAVSVFIETTQLTGIWGIYECAYRVFDVDDMITNTTGAVLGSILALVVPKRLRGMGVAADRDEPRPVTRTRRLIGAACDVLGAGLLAVLTSVAVQAWLEYVAHDRVAVLAGDLAPVVSGAVVAVVWLLVIATTGRSVGDLAVEIEYRGPRGSTILVRAARFVGGVGAFFALTLLPEPWSAAAWVFALAALLAVVLTKHGRGLPGLLAGSSIVDARATGPVDTVAASE